MVLSQKTETHRKNMTRRSENESERIPTVPCSLMAAEARTTGHPVGWNKWEAATKVVRKDNNVEGNIYTGAPLVARP